MTRERSRNYKSTTAILLFSAILAVSGCSSKKIITPIEKVTVDDMQSKYEHLPKPTPSSHPTVEAQIAEFDRYLSKSFSDIDKYKEGLMAKSGASMGGGNGRYGKNKLPIQSHKDNQMQRSSSVTATTVSEKKHYDLYPKSEKPIKKINHPLFRDL